MAVKEGGIKLLERGGDYRFAQTITEIFQTSLLFAIRQHFSHKITIGILEFSDKPYGMIELWRCVCGAVVVSPAMHQQVTMYF